MIASATTTGMEATSRRTAHGAREFGVVELGVVAVLMIIRFTVRVRRRIS